MANEQNTTFTSDSKAANVGIEDIDTAFHSWWNKKLDIYVQANSGIRQKVPVVFVAPERWEIARREGMRDPNGTLLLPIIAISRTGMSVAPDGPTARHFADTKQQVTYYYEIDPKTSLSYELSRKQRENADPHISIDPKAPIYQVYTRKAPDHYSITYEVKIWMPYIEHMNQVIQKIGQKMDYKSIKSFQFETESKYYFVAFQDDEINDDSNFEDYSGSERIVKKSFTFKVGAYLHPENDDEKPNFRKYFSQSKLYMNIGLKAKNQIPIIDPNDLQKYPVPKK